MFLVTWLCLIGPLLFGFNRPICGFTGKSLLKQKELLRYHQVEHPGKAWHDLGKVPKPSKNHPTGISQKGRDPDPMT